MGRRISELVHSETEPWLNLLFRQTAMAARRHWEEGWTPSAILREVAVLLGKREQLGTMSLMVVWRYAFWTPLRYLKEAALHVEAATYTPKDSFDGFMYPLIEAHLADWPDLELEDDLR